MKHDIELHKIENIRKRIRNLEVSVDGVRTKGKIVLLVGRLDKPLSYRLLLENKSITRSKDWIDIRARIVKACSQQCEGMSKFIYGIHWNKKSIV